MMGFSDLQIKAGPQKSVAKITLVLTTKSYIFIPYLHKKRKLKDRIESSPSITPASVLLSADCD